jgi:hypothetical protein
MTSNHFAAFYVLGPDHIHGEWIAQRTHGATKMVPADQL